MSLIPCPECKKKISDSAGSCPNCGYQITQDKVEEIKKKEKDLRKNSAIGCLSLAAIFIVVMIIISHSGSDSSKKQPVVAKSSEEIRKEQIEKNFSSWDGSHRGLTELIKKSMNDPKSYEHVETVYWDKGDYLLVKTTFRGKNAFGGVVPNSVTAKVDLNGNVSEIIAQEP